MLTIFMYCLDEEGAEQLNLCIFNPHLVPCKSEHTQHNLYYLIFLNLDQVIVFGIIFSYLVQTRDSLRSNHLWIQNIYSIIKLFFLVYVYRTWFIFTLIILILRLISFLLYLLHTFILNEIRTFRRSGL